MVLQPDHRRKKERKRPGPKLLVPVWHPQQLHGRLILQAGIWLRWQLRGPSQALGQLQLACLRHAHRGRAAILPLLQRSSQSEEPRIMAMLMDRQKHHGRIKQTQDDGDCTKYKKDRLGRLGYKRLAFRRRCHSVYYVEYFVPTPGLWRAQALRSAGHGLA